MHPTGSLCRTPHPSFKLADFLSSAFVKLAKSTMVFLPATPTLQELHSVCCCQGTAQHVHYACLTSWVMERGNLACELW